MKVEVCPFLFWCLCSFVVPLVQLSTFVTVSICKIPQFKSIES